MITGYAIADRASGIPSYYSAEVSRKLAVPNGGWTQEPKRALLFLRRIDAEEFRKTFLLTIGEMMEVLPLEVQGPANGGARIQDQDEAAPT